MTEKNNGLNHKIARIMGRLDRLPKSGTNKHFKYKYVTESDVADMIRAELATENIAFFASMVDAVQNAQHTVAKFEFTFVCADTGESKTLTWYGEANDGQDKGISKAATSAEKFFLLKTFICSTGDPTDDPDSDGRTPELRQNAKTTPKTHEAPEEVSDIGDIVWTRDKARLTNLRNKAAELWDVPYNHTYYRLAIIIGSDLRPKSFPAYAEMMENECAFSAAEIWAGIEAYVPQSEQEAE